MPKPEIASRETWLDARRALLEEEKALTRARDALAEKRRALPWVRLEADYRFTGPDGDVTLADLFGPHGQLIVQHFMYGPDWENGCPSCSFWADNFDGIAAHLAARDTAFVLVARAPFERLRAFRARKGWSLPLFSSLGSRFNHDFQVSFEEGHSADAPVTYNYRETTFPAGEAPGVSVFVRDADGTVFHTYSTYSRGLDILNGTYHLLDLTPKGRDEADGPMHWLKHREAYDAA